MASSSLAITSRVANCRGTLPNGVSLEQVMNIQAHPQLVRKILTTSSHTRVYLLHGDHVLRIFVPENRSSSNPNALEVYDLQVKVGDHPFIEKPHFAYKGEEEEALITGFRQVTTKFILTKTILEKILSALLHMDKNGVQHEDLGSYNIGLDQNGDPFIYDFGCARGLDWHSPNLEPEVIEAFFLGPPSCLKVSPFNIDLLLNFYFADQLIQREEAGEGADAIQLYICFLKCSIPYFLQLQGYFRQEGIFERYIQAISRRIERIRTVLDTPGLVDKTYDDKILGILFAARQWAKTSIEQEGRNELMTYLDLAQRRLLMWLNSKSLRSS
jgi:serine/threonine protein kinase